MIRRFRPCRAAVPATFVLVALFPIAAPAQSGTWSMNVAGTYNWSQAANWQSGIVADGANNTANFTTAGVTGNITVTLDTARTIGALVFGDPNNSFPWTLSGANTLTLSNSAAGGPTINVSEFTPSATISVPLAGTQGLTKTGNLTLILTGTNTYSGGTTVNDGTLAVNSDANLGSGTVTVSALGMVNFLSTATSAHTYNLSGGGTLAANPGVNVTLNVGSLTGGYLDGAGTFTTAAAGVLFTSMTNSQSTTTVSASPADRFINFSNNGTLEVAANVQNTTPATFNGFINQGSATITLDGASHSSASSFQSFGVINIDPAAIGSGQQTLLTNTGTTPLAFNGGSRTFIGTPATASQNGVPTFVAGIDLHGQNLTIVGGLFVNNGFVEDTVGNGKVIVDAGALYKGAGFSGVQIVTQNGGRVQAGNSPGFANNAALTIGPGGLGAFNWEINDAITSGGPHADFNNQVSGWSQERAIITNEGNGHISTGNLTWTATSTTGNQFQLALFTLLNPSTVGQENLGPMADFNPLQPYDWPFLTYAGTYTGPTDSATLTADTQFDTSQFQNPINGAFSIALDSANRSIDILYTPVPEPGTLALVGLAAAGLAWRRRKGRA